jgi:UDP-N-acetylmuramoyl-tripeptide--D-alanyl-D-alanine ligase
MRFSLAEIAEVCGGRVVGRAAGAVVGAYHTDSRQLTGGGLFFALQGAAMDGHAFVGDAGRRGATAAVVARPVATTVPQVVVPDTWRALYDLAAHALDRVAPLVVGVTGSSGKTSTKELAAAALGARHRVHRTAGNLNTETGLPLTMLQIEPEHTALVLEMGMQGPGEIARLCQVARPRVGVITCVGSAHAEFFAEGRDGIARAKGELLQALPPDGLAVLNADDPYFAFLSGLSPAPVFGFGLDAGDLRGERYQRLASGCSFRVEGVDVSLPLAGRHQARNALAALAVARFAGVPLDEAAPRLREVRVTGRLQELPQPGGWTLVDDAYNANPESMLAAFEVLSERRPARLLALLGEMRELGGLAEEAHRRVGAAAAGVFDQVAVVAGGWGATLADAAGADLLSDLDAALAWLGTQPRPGDLVLVKASNGVALHTVVRRLGDTRGQSASR